MSQTHAQERFTISEVTVSHSAAVGLLWRSIHVHCRVVCRFDQSLMGVVHSSDRMLRGKSWGK